MLLIGITGLKGAGKSTVAARLCSEHGFWALSLAEPLKHGLLEMFRPLGMTWAHLDDPLLKERPIHGLGTSPRKLMQTLGTEWGRNLVADDIWLRVASARLEKAAECGIARVAVPDVRFANELAWLRQHHGILIEVKRPRHDMAHDAHTSEVGLGPGAADVTLRNDADLAELDRAVDRCMVEIAHGLIRARAA